MNSRRQETSAVPGRRARRITAALAVVVAMILAHSAIGLEISTGSPGMARTRKNTAKAA
jgi:hypothetical protein